MKPTKRKAFNFLRSYFDIFNKLKNDKQKIEFINALLDKQFLDVNPENLDFVVELAYEGVRHQVEQSVKGYKSKTKDPMADPCQGGIKGCNKDPLIQEEEKEKEKEKEQGKGKGKEEEKEKKLVFPFDSLEFKKAWENWKVYKKEEFNFKFKSIQSQQASLTELNNKSGQDENTAIEIIHQSMSNGWKGFFKLKNQNNEKRNTEKRIGRQTLSDIKANSQGWTTE